MKKVRKRRRLRSQGNRTLPRRSPSARSRVLIAGAHDPAEKAADKASEQVMKGKKVSPLSPAGAAVYRECAGCEEKDDKDKKVKRSPGAALAVAAGAGAAHAGESASVAIRSLGPGKPLSRAERAFFEPRFGRDLAHVRIHDGPAADRAARAIDARAFAYGSDIAFARDQYRPETPKGRRRLAHEVAHTLQDDQEAVRRQAVDDDSTEIEMPEDYVGRSLTMRSAEMCGPDGCFTDERIYADANRSRADDAAADARAKAARKRRRDILRHGTKQQKWQLEFEDRYSNLKGVGSVAGTRDDGIMTPVGVRVPQVKGDFLSPRPFYESHDAALLAWQGFIHYAELAEAGHGPAAVHMSASNGGHPLRDDQLDLASYAHWSYRMKTTSEAVASAMTLAEGANALTGALGRSALSPAASELIRIAEQPAAVAGETITIQGVAFQNLRVVRTGDELAVGVPMLERLGAAAGQGKAMWVEFERAALEAGRKLGVKNVRIGALDVRNEYLRKFFGDLGYKPDFASIGAVTSQGWFKVLKP